MRPDFFDPKAGTLELAFQDGTSYSLALIKTYHREEAFYVDLFWEEKDGSLSLSLALHPKAESLTLKSCKLIWPLVAGGSYDIISRDFTNPRSRGANGLVLSSEKPRFLKKMALRKLNAFDPLPNFAGAQISYQAISLCNKSKTLEIKSTDESAALTVFSIEGNALSAENQSAGYQLRHSFPAFELAFKASPSRMTPNRAWRPPSYSVQVSPSWLEQSMLRDLSQSALFTEGNIDSIIFQHHPNPSPGKACFDASLFSAFAKTCIQEHIPAGISLNPFVVPAEDASPGIQVVRNPKFKRWSPSLGKWVYPLDLSHEDTLRACEQHLLRFFQLGYRLFIIQDVTLSLMQGLGITTTGQQLNQRLDLLRRVLPGATILLADLCPAEVFTGFQGFRTFATPRTQLPRFARLAGLGVPKVDHGKLAPYLLPASDFSMLEKVGSSVVHRVFDLSDHKLNALTWIALEASLESANYPTWRISRD